MHYLNKEIEVNAFAFINKQQFKSVPRTITVDNHRYAFIDAGIRYLVKQGEQFIRLFDMTDGRSIFRLRLENDHWTIVSIKALS